MNRQMEAPALLEQRTGRGCLSEATGTPILAQPPAQNHLALNRQGTESGSPGRTAFPAGRFVARWPLLVPNWCTEAQAVALLALLWGARA